MTPRQLVAALLAPLALGLGVTGCGGGSSASVQAPSIGAARVYSLAGFTPTGSVAPGRTVQISFHIQQPDGQPLTRYRTGSGPHTGVHLIIVRQDLAYIIHRHPPIGPDGRLTQPVTFPAPGRYRVLVDAYPANSPTQPNFQLFATVNVRGAYHPRPLPPFQPVQNIDGYRVAMQGHPALHAIQAQFVHVRVSDPAGRPVSFTPWYGALAHAIFFHAGSLDYFHTHVCGPGATGCASSLGGARVSGTSAGPGRLTLGVLLPVPGTWRLFLQMKLGSRVITAPFTLRVAS